MYSCSSKNPTVFFRKNIARTHTAFVEKLDRRNSEDTPQNGKHPNGIVHESIPIPVFKNKKNGHSNGFHKPLEIHKKSEEIPAEHAEQYAAGLREEFEKVMKEYHYHKENNIPGGPVYHESKGILPKYDREPFNLDQWRLQRILDKLYNS